MRVYLLISLLVAAPGPAHCAARPHIALHVALLIALLIVLLMAMLVAMLISSLLGLC